MIIKNENELKVKVTSDIKDYMQGMKNVKRTAKDTAKSVGSDLKKMDGFISDVGAASKAGLAVASVVALEKLGAAALDLAAEADRADRALKGLDATSKGYGQNVNEVRKITKELTDDGLVSMPKMAEAVKNWISMGYSPEQTKKIIENNKEIAINNRLVDDLGESLVDTSKGFRTNSQELIENSGVTKINGAYVQGVIDKHAVLNGMLEQGKRNTGAVAGAMEDYGSKVSQLETEFGKLKISIGEGLKEPLSESMVILTKLLKGLTDFSDKANERSEIANIAQDLYKNDLVKKKTTGNENQWARAAGVSQEYWDTATTMYEERKNNGSPQVNNNFGKVVTEEKKPETINQNQAGNFKADNNTSLLGIGENGVSSFGANMGGEFSQSSIDDKSLEILHTKTEKELAEMTYAQEKKREKLEQEAADIVETNKLKEEAEKSHNARIAHVREVGVQVYGNFINAISTGQMKSLSDFKKFAVEQLKLVMQQEASNAVTRGGADIVKGVSAAADPLTAGLAPGLFAAAGKEFAFAALMGSGAAVVGGMQESSSENKTDNNNTPEPTERSNQADLNNRAEEMRGKVTVYVDDEELYGMVYNKSIKYAKDNDLDFIITNGEIKDSLT